MADEKEKKSESDKEEEVEDTESEDTETEEETEEEEESEGSSKEDKKDDIDYEAELLEEEKRGKPDPEKAKDAFKEREEKREEKSEDEGDKPLTRKDVNRIRAEIRTEVQGEQALDIARKFAGSESEAKLIVAKWRNRVFPEGMMLSEQLEEAYAITHRKRLIGQRNEAFRALKSKDGVIRHAPGAQRDGVEGKAPKLSAADAVAYKGAGYEWNGSKRLYQKSLSRGRFLYKDPKTGRTFAGK